MTAHDGVWHHICASWSSNSGTLKFYKDGGLSVEDEREDSFRKGYTIKQDGSLVLGQDQDSVGGSFQSSQSFEGMLSYVNVWDNVLTSAEIKMAKLCFGKGKEGNVYKWPDFLKEGGPRLVHSSPCKKAEVGMYILHTFFFLMNITR